MNKNRHANARIMLCNIAARKISKTIMKDIKEAEQDIGNACMVYHEQYEKRLGRPIETIKEFEKVTTEFSKLPKHEIEKLIQESRKNVKK